MALLSPSEFATQAGAGPLGSDADAAFVSAACAAVISYVRWNPERPAADAVAYLDGTGTSEVVVPGLPANLSVTELRLDARGGYGQVPNSFGAETVLTPGEGYLVDAARGILRMNQWSIPSNWLAGGGAAGGFGGGLGPSLYWGGLSTGGRRPSFWPRVAGCIKLTYRNGYAAGSIPGDLKAAVVQLAAWMRTNAKWGGLAATSQSYIDASVGLTQVAAEALGNVSMPALGTARSLLAAYREPVMAGGVR